MHLFISFMFFIRWMAGKYDEMDASNEKKNAVAHNIIIAVISKNGMK